MPYNPDVHGPVRIVGPGFRAKVYDVVRRVPAGAVTTYGDVGGVLGSPNVARQVGFALAAIGPSDDDVPWHRVVNAKGAISFRGDDARGENQRDRLRAEGIEVSDAGIIRDFAKTRFQFERP